MEAEALALQTALRRLPLEQREVVVLRIWGELTFEEVGVVVGCSTSTAASRFRYGCSKLRAVLRPLTREVADGRSAG
jgi:RNA polymerase sigma-70 factor (ECF subfamily)